MFRSGRWVVGLCTFFLMGSALAAKPKPKRVGAEKKVVAAERNPVEAEKKAVEAEKKLEAKKEADQASIAYTLGRFEDALVRYERAYELFQAPALLFNIGQCHRQLGRHERAVYFLTVYLRENPEAANRAQVDEILFEERALLKQEKERESARGPMTVQPASVGVAGTSSPVALSPIETTAQPSVATRWWFWTALAGGAAVVGTAIAVAVVMSQPEMLPMGTVGTLDRRQ